MNLSIIIPNYNGESLLTENLPLVYEAARHYKKGRVEIIIPDDPSTDRSGDVIQEFIDGIKDKNVTGKTISNKDKNLAGFSRNVNRGVKFATGDILILLNSDVIPRRDFLDYLLPHFEDEKVFAVGCLEESMENGAKELRGRGIGKWEKGFLMHSRGEINKTNTLWASGGSSAFSKKIWDKIGGLDQLYNPFYWEDNDLSYRALKSGYKIIFEKRSVVIHEHEKGAIKTSVKSDRVKRTAYRNQFIFVWLNITDQDLLLSHIGWLPYHLISAIERRDWNFCRGFLAALWLVFRVMDKRRQYVKGFVKSDREILANFTQ